ncbi:TetR/AcrR family transcriptional regulator [Shewanella psychropiezotolerans]|uniref:TetR/AcrR family transcriptional regulator n=1 Tax=Shewanella psychropiezotolerans TaxID=2593655 RepID=A0ABX5WUD6_9GAMM|nr:MULTISPECIES: TetR/AcrR family transcriptional regulator [Shewanella]MPY23056.1 TetR/AcrR family transcriptional regulator [Shewanella sp. YLB-07]QDO82715.1 TetR/AcrR family transcriptional regulator [Shewanella psychropiezotolerans]
MRNAEFDREKVLRSAMTAFMDKGYGKTSMQDLKKATGLHPGSIYCAFENKRGLLLAALEQYRLDRNAEFEGFFAGKHPVLVELKTYLDHIVHECQSCDAAQACLLTKALNEIAETDAELLAIITSNLANWQLALTQVFELAQAKGELTTERDAEHLARYFMLGVYGLRTFAHTHSEGDTLQELADQLYKDVCR